MLSLNMSSVVWFIMRISDEVSPSNCTRKTFIFIILYVISFSYDLLGTLLQRDPDSFCPHILGA